MAQVILVILRKISQDNLQMLFQSTRLQKFSVHSILFSVYLYRAMTYTWWLNIEPLSKAWVEKSKCIHTVKLGCIFIFNDKLGGN